MDISDKDAIRARQFRVPGTAETTRETADSSHIETQVHELRGQIGQLVEALQQSAEDKAKLLDICRALDDRISSYAVKVEKAA